MSLSKVYYDPAHPAGYAGARRLVKNKKNKTEIYTWLTGQDAYTVHKPVHRRFPRLYYSVDNIDDVWEADLVDLRSLQSFNDNTAYLLVVVDVLSKYAWVEPLVDKSVREVTKGFERILARSDGRSPVTLQTDRGKEFLGNYLQKFLSERDIRFRVARNPDIKASIVERFNRTLKERMWRFFTHRNTHRYIDTLQKFIYAYNHARHSSIKMEPAAVTLYNANIAHRNLMSAATTRRKKKRFSTHIYKRGDHVRISRTKGTFEKGYEKNFSTEIFQISRALKRQDLYTYEIQDLSVEKIEGFFYPEELTSVSTKRIADDQEFKIEHVIKTRGRGARKELFVKWLGYPNKFNSWIPAGNARDITV